MAVTRCVCHQRSFQDLARMAQKHAWTRVEQIQASTRAGTGCGSCVPYLHQVLSTGHTSFAVACNGQIPCPAPADPWD